MLHTNLNTWHAQESRKTERGEVGEKPGKSYPLSLTPSHPECGAVTHFRFWQQHKSHSSPCLQDVCHVYGCPSLFLPLSLYLHLTPSYIHLTSSEKPLLETKTSKNILPFLVVAKSLLFLCVGWFYVFGFERFCLLCICLAFSCTACRKKKKLGIAEKNVTRVDQKQGQKHIEGYKGVRTPLKLDFRYCFLLL